MIFVTVGTEDFPFDRLVRIADRGIKYKSLNDRIFVQIGTSTYEPKNCSWKRFMEFGIMIRLIRKARMVITHGGAGSILMCLALNKIPLVFPRYHKYGEHLDDHQVEFTKRMETEGKILAVYDEAELIDRVEHYDLLSSKLRTNSNSQLEGDLAGHLRELLGRSL